jgi:hypothetical protein
VLYAKITRQSQEPGATIRQVFASPKTISRLHSALAFALTLWCAGTGCLMVSYARTAAMASAEIPASQSPERSLAEASASMGSHACCKARRGSSRGHAHSATGQTESASQPGFQQAALPGDPASSSASSCCPLTSGSFLTQSRSQSDDDRVLALGHNDSLSFALTDSQIHFRAIPLRLFSQERSYLTGCAFLI